jgi:hypothetical protein
MLSQTASPIGVQALTQDVPDDRLAELVEEYLDAVLDSASVDVIGVSNWWPRAVNALTTSAARATCLRDMVTTCVGKMQIETLTDRSAKKIMRLERQIADPVVFSRWRRIAERDAIYVAAMVRLARADRRDTGKKPKPAVTTTADTLTEEPMF